MEISVDEIEVLLNTYLDGRADELTKQMIAAWLYDEQNLSAFYEFLLRFESNFPMVKTDVEKAIAVCKSRQF